MQPRAPSTTIVAKRDKRAHHSARFTTTHFRAGVGSIRTAVSHFAKIRSTSLAIYYPTGGQVALGMRPAGQEPELPATRAIRERVISLFADGIMARAQTRRPIPSRSRPHTTRTCHQGATTRLQRPIQTLRSAPRPAPTNSASAFRHRLKSNRVKMEVVGLGTRIRKRGGRVPAADHRRRQRPLHSFPPGLTRLVICTHRCFTHRIAPLSRSTRR